MNIVEKYLSEHFRFHIPDSFSVPRWHRNYWDFSAAQLSEVTSEWPLDPYSTQLFSSNMCGESFWRDSYSAKSLSGSMCGESFLRDSIVRNPHLGTPNWSDGVIPAFAFTFH